MDEFFKLLYDHAEDTNALCFSSDRKYRLASAALDRLVESLHPDLETQEKLSGTVNDLLYCTNVLSLAYGFRLGVRVTAPAGR